MTDVLLPPAQFCLAYQQQRCRSCQYLPSPYARQLQNKQKTVQQAFSHVTEVTYLPIVSSALFGFRNKAKMVVSGHWRAPILGVVDAQFNGVMLTDCPLYPEALRAAFAPLQCWISQQQLMPYHIVKRRGELKYILLTIDETYGHLMLRFVLRSTQAIPTIQAGLSSLQQMIPNLQVVSVNIQPLAAAIIEGNQEYVLSDTKVLTHWVNAIPLYCHPRSFFQTNTAVAAALYRQAQQWIAHYQPRQLWDLFCGVGGFALHAAQVMTGEVVGIEINADAIASAQQSAHQLELASRVHFRALAADEFALGSRHPDGIIVNPPRRGIGAALCHWINHGDCRWLIYSSCHMESLLQDLKSMPNLRPIQVRVFDMFAHTAHIEVLVLLERITSTDDCEGNEIVILDT